MGKKKKSKSIVVDWYEAASILGFNDDEMNLWIDEERMPFTLEANPESEELEFRAQELNEFSARVYSLVRWGDRDPEWRTLWTSRNRDENAELVCRWVEARQAGVRWRSTMGNV
ncbi:hypothetical protein GALL_297410 [mine drainage metagenome]|uniref:Uncharacterized protein n=1 Tax=mine drainage metagenome TaxID=410659 RepID=A0A1J5R8I2_9ZZZZ